MSGVTPYRKVKSRRRMKMKANTLLGITLLLLISPASYADDAHSWNSLSESQRAVLAKFEDDWDSLPAKRRERLSRGAEHWSGMSKDQRKDAKTRFSNWQDLPDERKERIRKRYDEYSSLPPDDQRVIRENFRRFNRMNPERRQKMRKQYQDMTPEQKQRFRDHMKERPKRQPPD